MCGLFPLRTNVGGEMPQLCPVCFRWVSGSNQRLQLDLWLGLGRVHHPQCGLRDRSGEHAPRMKIVLPQIQQLLEESELD